MSTPYLGEIQIFGFNYAPLGWAQCNGAVLLISQNTALFSLIGVSYGGNGRTTFQLPNFAGRTACSQGQGAGLTQRNIGDTFGSEEISLSAGQLPTHTHAVNVYHQTDATLQNNVPLIGDALIMPSSSLPFVPGSPMPDATLAASVIGASGGNQPHENRQPLVALNFCIALQGEFPAFD